MADWNYAEHGCGLSPAHGVSPKALRSKCSETTASWQKQPRTGRIRESRTRVGPEDKKFRCTVRPNQYTICQLHVKCPFGKYKVSLGKTWGGLRLLFLPKIKIIKWTIREQKSTNPKYSTLLLRLISLLSRPFPRTSSL